VSAAPPAAPLREGRLVHAGHGYHWELHGTGGRETVCLFNGLAMSTKSWLSFLPELTGERDVLLYDYLGQGTSDDADVPDAISAFGDALAAILDAGGIARVHAIGVSYGGFVAAEFARRHPARAKSLTLSGILLTNEALFEMYQDVSLRFYAGGPPLFDLYTRYLYEKIFAEAFVARVGPKLESMRQAFHDRYAGRIESLDGNAASFAAIPCPVLVLAGAEDRAIPTSQQRKIPGVIPHARYEEIPGAGHVVYLEKPDVFWPRVRRFLDGRPA
jgi:pimeloyl-ACP methyl ester carboxylesterase